jgi:hypothetical protein
MCRGVSRVADSFFFWGITDLIRLFVSFFSTFQSSVGSGFVRKLKRNCCLWGEGGE